MRTCGGCTFCCWNFAVDDVGKSSHQHCRHECERGCAIYNQPNYPAQCRDLPCPYLDGQDIHRPDAFQLILEELDGKLNGYFPCVPMSISIESALDKLRKTRVLPVAFNTSSGWVIAPIPIDQYNPREVHFSTEHHSIWENA